MTGGATLRILGGVLAGLGLGIAAGPQSPFIPTAQLVGGVWLDGLRMTVIPLVFGLIVTGIGSTLRQGGAALTQRALMSFVALLVLSALVGMLLGELLFAGWELPGPLAQPQQALPTLPATADTIRALIPANPIGAAAQGAIVPVVIFALIFAFALGRIEAARAHAIGELLAGVVDTMLVIVGWVLWLAPVGVFALAFAVAAQTGLAVGAALGWYVLVQIIATLSLALIIYAMIAASRRVPLRQFVRATLPAQAVAFTTQSSLASLPAMLTAARTLGLARAEADMLLPMAVALFRIAAPASIVIVSLALAHLAGVTLGPVQFAIIGGLAVVNTLTIAGLPNQITFFAAYAPPALAAGVPIELLPLMLAVDAIPDMAYTLSNVTADLGVTALLSSQDLKAD
jgi:Na+/H+-dicarboxylate symporter